MIHAVHDVKLPAKRYAHADSLFARSREETQASRESVRSLRGRLKFTVPVREVTVPEHHDEIT